MKGEGGGGEREREGEEAEASPPNLTARVYCRERK